VDEISNWALVALAVIAAIQGWAVFGPWAYRKAYPARFEISLGEGGRTTRRHSGTVGTVTLRFKSLCRRHLKVEQLFFLYSEQLELQQLRLGGIQLPVVGHVPIVNVAGTGRVRTIAAPTQFYFANGDELLVDLVFRFPSSGDYIVSSRIWPLSEPVVTSEVATINVSEPDTPVGPAEHGGTTYLAP